MNLPSCSWATTVSLGITVALPRRTTSVLVGAMPIENAAARPTHRLTLTRLTLTARG